MLLMVCDTFAINAEYCCAASLLLTQMRLRIYGRFVII